MQTITFASSGSNTMTTTKSYDNLDRLFAISTAVNGPANGDPGLSNIYAYNLANERTRCTLGDGSYWSYGYNPLGQVTSGSKLLSSGTAVPGEQFGYSFDGIGNRIGTTVNGRSASYNPNLLNQYTSRDVSGAVDILGMADPGATITANDEPTVRGTNGTFYKALSVSNSTAPVWQAVKVVGVKNNEGPSGDDVVAEQDGSVYVPKTPEQYIYDSDGNLTQDGRWVYTWNGENQLIAMESISSVPVAAKKRLQFNYDYMGRRVEKQVYTWNATTGTYQAVSATQFLYDGWNLTGELNGANSLLRSYLWGSDLSGELQGAGGVGGLIAITNHTAGANAGTYFPGYDGNGNILDLVQAGSSHVVATYEYGPFGEVLRASGTIAELNPFQFSTKYTDVETGFDNYGHRYYEPEIGRWLSRDPSEEDGGSNLYAFLSNEPSSHFDYLGLVSTLSYSPQYLDSKDNGCGNFTYSIKWRISPASLKGGFISQTIIAAEHVQDCDGKPLASESPHHFTETWRVSPASGWFWKSNRIQNNGIDTFLNNTGGQCTRGIVVVVAEAVFNEDVSNLPLIFSPGGGGPSGRAPSAPGSVPVGGSQSNVVRRAISYQWDCCGKKEDSKVTLPDEIGFPAYQPPTFNPFPPVAPGKGMPAPGEGVPGPVTIEAVP